MSSNQLQSVNHVVVLMLENRSFDHMLGFLYATTGRGHAVGLVSRRWLTRQSTSRFHRAAPDAWNAWNYPDGGSIFAAARNAGTSDAAIPLRPSTRRRTRPRLAIRSSRASSRARSGSGTTAPTTSTPGRNSPARTTIPRISRSPVPPDGSPLTGRRCSTDISAVPRISAIP